MTLRAGSPVLPDSALEQFATALRGTVAALFPQAPQSEISFEASRRPEFGDFATNVAFGLTKIARRSPQDLAAQLVAHVLEAQPGLRELFSEITPTAGFINVRLAPAVWQNAVAHIVREGPRAGRSHAGTKISLEFGSANPTGPLVVVQGRTCSIGATLANALRFCGYDVFVEWIINDAGAQMETLGKSLYARYRQIFEPDFPFPEDGYPGDYLPVIAQELAQREGRKWLEVPQEQAESELAQIGRDILVAGQMQTVQRFRAKYDLWQSEKEMHDTGRIQAGIDRLRQGGHTYEQDGALFFRATQFGDDKDRVLVRRDGRPTYFANDVAYHYEKLQRADRVIDILGPDHHGYIGRLKGLAEALGFNRDHLDVLIAQQITLMRHGVQVSMSKRAGHIITLDDIIDEVGVDAARFFFIMMAPESPLTFDLELAKEQSNDNPVYYVQYSHARICSVFKNADAAEVQEARSGDHVTALEAQSEIALARRLAEMPSTVENVAEQFAPHRLTRYARDVASDFHQFYHECRILVEDREQRLARLSLCLAAQRVLSMALEMIGVCAPQSM